MASVTKRGSRWFLMYRDVTGKEVQRTSDATTKTEAKLLAQEIERAARRIREGRDPAPPDQTRIQEFGELLDWWAEWYEDASRAYTKASFIKSVKRHWEPLRHYPATPGTARALAQEMEKLLQGKVKAGMAPQTANHLRSAAYSVFKRASHPLYAKWHGENPVQWVTRYAVKKTKREILTLAELQGLMEALPEPDLAHPWRWIFSVMAATGARPGEALGAKKVDIDTRTWVWNICRSWDNDQPKDDDPREVLIVPALRSILVAAMKASPSDRVFCKVDGKPFSPASRHVLQDQLRRGMKRAGLVTGYRYKCRRKGCGFVEERSIAAYDERCPRCEMRLWVSGISRRVRVYDLRHSFATLLRRARVDIGAVQRHMGHASPETTAAIYDHSEIDVFLPEFGRALAFLPPPPPTHAVPMQLVAGDPKGEAPAAPAFAKNDGGFIESGRLDLNQRPLAPQASALPGCATPRVLQGRDR